MKDRFEQFTDELTGVLKTRGVAGLDEIAEKLRPLLLDGDFAARAFPDELMHKRVLFHDPSTDVYVLAHVHGAKQSGRPHSHGESWAIYGNVRGATDMTEWRRDAEGEGHAVLVPISRYRLNAGDARAYPPHTIHSTAHPGDAWVIRVTGTDLDKIPRYRFDSAKERIAEAPGP